MLNQNERKNSYNWAIEVDGKLVGSINVCEINEATDLCGVAYCLGYNYWGMGIVTEACKAVVGYILRKDGSFGDDEIYGLLKSDYLFR